MPNRFIRHLRELNRKERYWVVQAATMGGFAIADEFIRELAASRIPIPAEGQRDQSTVFIAMDYHLDWIYASLFLAHNGTNDANRYPNGNRAIKGNQEDIDLIVAFPDPDEISHTNLVMIEAKGDSPWTNAQARSKGERLHEIFGAEGTQWPDVTPHYRIWSPKPTGLAAAAFPPWALDESGKLHWMPLKMAANLRKVCRLDQIGDFWKVE